jgi:hypothetical protein
VLLGKKSSSSLPETCVRFRGGRRLFPALKNQRRKVDDFFPSVEKSDKTKHHEIMMSRRSILFAAPSRIPAG